MLRRGNPYSSQSPMRGISPDTNPQYPSSRGRAGMAGIVSRLRFALLIFFAALAFMFFFKSYPSRTDVYHREFKGNEGFPRIAKVSMLYGEENRIYERAIRSHQKHDEKYNYPFHVLRENVASGYWNKPSYLLSLIVQELAKPKHERVEWLMWVDADLILINPSVPLEPFLPPDDFPHVHFLGNKDQNGLNTGTFFLHVHEWSVRMLTKAMAFPMYRPDVNLEPSVDQKAMQYVFNETEYAPGVLFQPRPWYNTYEWKHAYEGKKGNLLVHFPGLEEERWSHMSKWLSIVENYPAEWDVPYETTFYPEVIRNYWDSVRDAIVTLNMGEKILADQGDSADAAFRSNVEDLKYQVLFAADMVDSLKNATALVREITSSTNNGGQEAKP